MGVEGVVDLAAAASPALLALTAPVTTRVSAYFAPVARALHGAAQPTVWDAGGIAALAQGPPPAPWIDLGYAANFVRKSETKVEALTAGAPGVASGQVRTLVEATVAFELESWGKLQLALTAGVQQMNVLATQAGAAANGSGGAAIAAVPLMVTNEQVSVATTASALDVSVAAAAGFSVGQLVVCDVDYGGQTGFVGSGVSGGYVKAASLIGNDIDYIRRVSLNVARVVTISGGVLGLGSALIAGVPVAGMQVSPVVAFCDREGGSFFQEWSALFVVSGVQGDQVVFHYPRLQALAGAAEASDALGVPAAGLERMRLRGSFRALPVNDATDGEAVVCFRTYLPAAMRVV